MKRYFYAIATRVVLFVIYATVYIASGLFGLIGRLVRSTGNRDGASGKTGPFDVMLIGTFYTRNWCLAHLGPLSLAKDVRHVTAIVDGPTEPLPGVEYTPPPRWLSRIVGRSFAKLCWAFRLAIRTRPHVVMGYHFIPGAISALLVARAVGASAIYQATGGETELAGGGAMTENVFVKRLGSASPMIERLVHLIARRFDMIVVRGESARDYMTRVVRAPRVGVVPGSIRADRFATNGTERSVDVISVGRLVPIKQPDQLLDVFARLKPRYPGFRATVVGDGPLLESLVSRCAELGLAENVRFVGHVEGVEEYLAQAKVFLLTSRSEGLSIAMAEAMASGVVPVVADVGDLRELVRHDVTGRLVPPDSIDAYVDSVGEMLDDPDRLRVFSAAAQKAAVEHNDVSRVAAHWGRLLVELQTPGSTN